MINFENIKKMAGDSNIGDKTLELMAPIYSYFSKAYDPRKPVKNKDEVLKSLHDLNKLAELNHAEIVYIDDNKLEEDLKNLYSLILDRDRKD